MTGMRKMVWFSSDLSLTGAGVNRSSSLLATPTNTQCQATFTWSRVRVRVHIYRFQETRVYMYFNGGRSHWYEFCTSKGYLWISLVRAVRVQVVFLSKTYEVNNTTFVVIQSIQATTHM